MISALDVMGAMSKQIRREIRTCFFTKVTIPVYLQGGASFKDLDGHGYAQRFLEKIGTEGGAALPELIVSVPNFWPLDSGRRGYESFQSLLKTLSELRRVRKFNLELSASHIFRADPQALQDYLLHGQAPQSQGLEDFVTFLTSLPSLQTVHINVMSESRLGGGYRVEKETEPFLVFAFSGIREMMLWTEINERLQGNDRHAVADARKLEDKVFVWTKCPSFKLRADENDAMDYTKWLA
jgi:hypothetical protein